MSLKKGRPRMIFKCPRCGGPYFGRDLATKLIECHCNEHGESLSMDIDVTDRPAMEAWMKQSTKLCGWVGGDRECMEERKATDGEAAEDHS